MAGHGTHSESTSDAVSEGFCAGFIIGIVQLLNNIEVGVVPEPSVDNCWQLPDNYYRAIADMLDSSDAPSFSGRVVSVLNDLKECDES